jgi:uncharacterized protein (DUF2236 family)
MESFLSEQNVSVAIVVTVLISLLKIIEFLIGKLSSEKSNLTKEEQKQLEEVFELVSAKDKDGMPLFYVPRTWMDLQRTMMDKMERITSSQERTTYVLETIVRSLEQLCKK